MLQKAYKRESLQKSFACVAPTYTFFFYSKEKNRFQRAVPSYSACCTIATYARDLDPDFCFSILSTKDYLEGGMARGVFEQSAAGFYKD